MEPTSSGRCNRAKYFLRILLIALPIAVIAEALVVFVPPEERPATESLLWFLNLVALAALLPITVKRLHDVNMSGWCYFLFLIPVINLGLGLYLLFKKGTKGPNQYGQDPLGKSYVAAVDSTAAGNITPPTNIQSTGEISEP